ncbi:membrane protein insertase YidC [Fulvivirgaceae bacterium PWU4]|uniref:Membrane protein insertase YidC n=1 Tax=Chryseosolibacter histidini TaxID=2782349 RepID=A0AAP2DN75_9BACT|nr:membrane protein insertase YidC [Chryseosolibacter histidini]MBT1698308.1 membrane protein insertase YidC [Chryseosolibacter histidini]
MDRNSAIGLTLIAVLLMAYFYWFAPQPQPASQRPAVTQTPQATSPDTTAQQVTAASDSALAAAYGDLSTFAQGKEDISTIETEDVRISFSNKGGIIKTLELKHYQTYKDFKNERDYDAPSQKNLKLISPDRSRFNLLSKYQGKDIDLYALYYKSEQSKKGDSTVVTFSATLSNGAYLRHTYTIPAKGYEIRYSISQKGLDQDLTSENLTFQWDDQIKPLEKDLQDTRIYTTISYNLPSEGFDELAARSTDTETEAFTGPVKWTAIKQKFFLSSIIAKNNFAGGEITTTHPGADTSVVKYAKIKLLIPKNALADGTEDFKFYVGPNDYQEIGKVTDEFTKNVYLGWPPVYWINKFVIFPVFHLLTKVISNYGLIIIVLVILLKLVLAPLSYRSYLSMAKMKVLKPELDEIKEKHGEDMTKVQQEQLKLYQSVGVNPISGCVPVLLQMPILFAMFYLFPASIELRQQPFLWAEDLSTYDSLIQLPFTIPFGVGDHISLFTLLMTISTLIYTWQNNQLSSVQGPMKSMSYIMPVIFFFVLNSFSAGLTFYYFISNLVTFAQQAIIRRFVDDNKIKVLLEENRKKNAAGNGKKSKFMTKLQDAMKASEEAKRKAEETRKRKK